MLSNYKVNQQPKCPQNITAFNLGQMKHEHDLQCGERVQGIEGAGCHSGDLVVIEREQADRAQPREAVVAHTAHTVAPQHPEKGTTSIA